MTSKPEKQIITIHVLPNISRSKGSQAMKFGQLIEYNMRNISLEKSYTKCGGNPSTRQTLQKIKVVQSLDQWSEMICSLYLLYVQVEVYQNILKLGC